MERISFKIMSKCGWMDNSEITAIGYINQLDKKVVVEFPEEKYPNEEYESYEDLIAFMPGECYIIFD